MTAHSKLGASSSEIWTNCAGSVRLSEGIPSTSSAYADEGTKAHEVASTFLTTGRWLHEELPDGMLEAVKVYTDEVLRLKGPVTEMFVEQRLDLSSIHPQMFGTADAVLYHPKDKKLRVFDYKHGAGVPVDVKDNLQLQYYGLGAMLMLNKPVESIELIIVQPRCFHVDGPIRRWEVTPLDMLELVANLREFAEATEKPNAPLKQGSWCRWCRAAGICPELHKNALAIAKSEFSPAKAYDPVKLAQTLNWLDVFEAWAKSVREFAYNEAQHGRVPPGFKLVQKRATRKWLPSADAEIFAKKFGGDKFRYMEMDLRSPASVEKLLTKEQKESLDSFCEKVSSGLALVNEFDKREAVKMDAKSEFSQIATSIFD